MNEQCPISCPVLGACDSKIADLSSRRDTSEGKALRLEMAATHIPNAIKDQLGVVTDIDTKRYSQEEIDSATALQLSELDRDIDFFNATIQAEEESRERIASACIDGPQTVRSIKSLGKKVVQCSSPQSKK